MEDQDESGLQSRVSGKQHVPRSWVWSRGSEGEKEEVRVGGGGCAGLCGV